jgi:tape measure domain-containing protein
MADATRRVSVRLSLDDAARVKSGLREVGETGSRSLERIRAGAEGASRGLDLLDAAMRGVQAVALAAGIRQIVQAGDALTQSLFRLQNATGSVQAAAQVYEQLYRSALQTGVAVADSADAFQRFSVAARAIGATNEQVARLVTGLQASAIVSGASAQEIGSATLQLAQALASGTLQGDELRSMLEAMPLLAEALARELGVGVGELRKLGSEGQLTADRVFPALLRATEALGRQLEQAPLTVARAFGQLQVSTGQFLGQLDQAIGLSNTLARALSGAARALDGVRRGSGLTLPSEDLAARRRQLEGIDGQIAQLEAGSATTPRRGSVRPGLVGTAEQQAGVDQGARLEELRRERLRLIEQIDTAEREALIRRLDEQQTAEQRAAESRRERAAAEIAELRPRLDAQFRIRQEFDERSRRLNDALAAGAIDQAERDRLAAFATRERDEALQRLEGSTRRVAGAQRQRNAEDREGAEITREVASLIQQNETATERYARRLSELGQLVERASARGIALPDETVGRAAQAALDDLTRATAETGERTRETSDIARDLGLTFSSAFEDAIVRGASLRDVIKGIGDDLLRIGTRRLVTEPLVGLLSQGISGAAGGAASGEAGSFLSGIFAAAAGAGGREFHQGGMVGAGGVPVALPGALWANAPRFHEGGWPGLRPDEVPAILQRGERVLSREEVRQGGAAPTIVMHITTPDASSFRASQAQILAEMNRAMARGRRGL